MIIQPNLLKNLFKKSRADVQKSTYPAVNENATITKFANIKLWKRIHLQNL